MGVVKVTPRNKLKTQKEKPMIAQHSGFMTTGADMGKGSRKQPRVTEPSLRKEQTAALVYVYSGEQLTDEQIAALWNAAPSRDGVEIIDTL